MNTSQIFLLCLCGAFFLVVALIAAIGDHYSLKGIPNKPVGNGQHGTARFATNGEVAKTYKHIPYAPKLWRKGEQLQTPTSIFPTRRNYGEKENSSRP